MIRWKLFAASVATLWLFAGNAAQAVTIDFEAFGHGDVVSATTISGVTILAHNPHQDHDIGALFDTRVSGSRDRDLEAHSSLGGGSAWSGGNLSEAFLGFDPDLGNILIVQENKRDCGTGTCSRPDDQAGGGATLDFLFDVAVSSFGFDAVDIESGESGGTIVLHDGAGSVSFAFDELLPSALFGDNTANRFDPLVASQIGLEAIDRVTIVFGGSGGIDNLTFEQNEPVPEPSTFALLGLGLAGIASQGRQRRP
ncbi:MAG: PEP-CTERM sorting domain-containing protein [Deltaproteobacteria bacterium]|nr:PEP-CTERM sorting domain-containing protein [Deltaproteobacteria bacterium]MBW2362767.1 PEP-CTERM sorting domain-containing protein [Deltaproteobacteria bacterium]